MAPPRIALAEEARKARAAAGVLRRAYPRAARERASPERAETPFGRLGRAGLARAIARDPTRGCFTRARGPPTLSSLNLRA